MRVTRTIIIWGMTMDKKTIAFALAALVMFSATACSGRPNATVIQTMESFATAQQSASAGESGATTLDSSLESIVLRGSGDDTYDFTYDSDIVTYSGQGGNFFLVGSSPTECYLHIMVQSGDETYEGALSTSSGRIVEEYTLDSGRRAFCYKTNDANTLHVIIEANDIVTSGNGIIKITIGSADSWLYSQDQIANMVDQGF